ncbi:MAG: helix-turn-helix transcriptional regulator [Clostridiales bacterium]|nr:helix-turn-helix transcriptional regulator [Clostridiales bacterium]
MTNTTEIKKRLVQNGLTQSKCARIMGISLTSFNSKINGKNDWTVSEIEKLCTVLKIPKGEVIKCFFCTRG